MQRSIGLKKSLFFLCLLLSLNSVKGFTGLNPNKSFTEEGLLKSYPIPDTFKQKERVQMLIRVAEEKRYIVPNVAVLFAEEATRLAGEKGMNKELADAYHLLGEIAHWSKNYELAMNHFYKSSALRKLLKDSVAMVDSYIQIGNVHLEQKLYDDAEYQYHKARELCGKINYATGKIDLEIGIGKLLYSKNKKKESEHYITQALIAAQREEYKRGEILAMSTLGELWLSTKDYQKAYDCFSLALKKGRKLNDQYLLTKILPLTVEALTYVNNAEPQAEQLAIESLALAKEMNLPEGELEALDALTQLYEKNGLFEKAYYIEKQRSALNQELTEKKIANSTAEVLVSYLNKEKRVQELEDSNEILKSKQKISQLYQMSALISVISIFIIIGFLYARLRMKSQSNFLLSEKNAELLETNAALERFAYVASHDLKEPLRTISSFTSLIARKYDPLLDAKGKEYIKFVVDGVSHMNYLLEDLLRYSRLVNKKDFVTEPVNLNQTLASVEKALSHKIGEQKAKIKYTDLPIVSSNSLHMHQLFQNLISNGLKFNDKAEPIIEIDCKPEENSYLISVKDNGIGIEKQYYEKIFEMFHRLSKNEYKGTGVGLAICRKITDMNGGKMWLESKQGEGTTFFFHLKKPKLV